MKTIVNADKVISSVIGEQRIKSADYRLMRYILSVEIEDGLLLHNVITGQLVLLTEEEQDALSRLPGRVDAATEPLISAYFLVPVDFDEYSFVCGYRKILQQLDKNKSKPITKYTILPTTCCNAHCFYCFESEYKKINMDKETAERVADFIIQHAEGNEVDICWFGGEPTVASKRIDEICQILREHGVKYVSGAVSNGYLFTEELVKKALEEWNLRTIQITLDGTEEIYNRTKCFREPGSAYQRVLNNIRLLLNAGVSVKILLNLDEYNRQDLYNLVDELAQLFSKADNFRISSHVLFNDEGYDKVHHTDELEEELLRENFRLAEYMRSVGLRGSVLGDVSLGKQLPRLRYLHCMANDSAAIVIGPNGSFFRCEHIEDSLESTASLDDGLFADSDYDYWLVPLEDDQCKDCPLCPDCFIPEKCKDNQKCYPFAAEQRMLSYREIAKTVYDGFLHCTESDSRSAPK